MRLGAGGRDESAAFVSCAPERLWPGVSLSPRTAGSPDSNGMALSPGWLLLLLPLPLLARPGVRADTAEAVVCAGAACFTAHWGKLSAEEAQLNCSTNGGNLATVRSAEEARYIQEALAQLLLPEAPLTARMAKFWIGLQREKGKCLDANLPLKGFSWIGGGENTSYTNWYKEPKGTCISKRCVSLALDLSLLPSRTSHLPTWSEGPCGNSGSPGSNIEGFVCKFSFRGMCRPLALGGPGQISYTTPFGASSSSLDAVPFASIATVACGEEGKNGSNYFQCREKGSKLFDWDTSGPLCVNSKLGCSFNNGGCQQECFEGLDGSFNCGCLPGYQLLEDMVTCASRNPCSSNPCRGIATCEPKPTWESYGCSCPLGYQLDPSKLGCSDIDECQASPCPQVCINTPGSFHCACWVGYEPGEGTCQDIDECVPGQNPCDQNCTNTYGSFHCSCEEGYVLAGEDGTQCQDIDECTSPGAEHCGEQCFNVPGSFHCGCLPGWERSPDGVSCTLSHGSPEPPVGGPTSQGEDQRSTTPSAKTSSTPKSSEDVYEEEPITERPSLQSNTFITHVPPKTMASSGSPIIRVEPSMSYPITVAGHAEPAALGLLIYRKRKASRAEKKENKVPSATDSYAWVAERAEPRATKNQYSPSPGTDC
ncbi:complement component C1q receptor isoform X2 [Echinops telfairi]|uniref:Complement component C1q receptor isoform X2 n=1 Tax=Echinops telfairi TaxID=9371 RepID=A0AC55DHM1_ECHTE|nr:complement component C1q receptor isoform X2 [Echinops telfairi]